MTFHFKLFKKFQYTLHWWLKRVGLRGKTYTCIAYWPKVIYTLSQSHNLPPPMHCIIKFNSLLCFSIDSHYFILVPFCEDYSELHHGVCPIHGPLLTLADCGLDQDSLQYTQVCVCLCVCVCVCVCVCD